MAIVHIGSDHAITSALGEGSRLGHGAKVYALDLRLLMRQRVGLIPPASTCAALYQLPERIRTTFWVASRWRLPIGLLFIEGEGSYQEIKADYQEWARHIPPGGKLAFPDERVRSARALKHLVREMIRPGMWILEPAQGPLFVATRR